MTQAKSLKYQVIRDQSDEFGNTKGYVHRQHRSKKNRHKFYATELIARNRAQRKIEELREKELTEDFNLI